jgi:dsRNA-specific ribonuclease
MFKEKRQAVIDDTRKTMSIIIAICQFPSLIKSFCKYLKQNNPLIITGTAEVVKEAVMKTSTDLLVENHLKLTKVLAGLTEHSDEKVRKAVLEAIGALQGKLGEDTIKQYIKDLNQQKQAIVNKIADQVSDSK